MQEMLDALPPPTSRCVKCLSEKPPYCLAGADGAQAFVACRGELVMPAVNQVVQWLAEDLECSGVTIAIRPPVRAAPGRAHQRERDFRYVTCLTGDVRQLVGAVCHGGGDLCAHGRESDRRPPQPRSFGGGVEC